MPPIDAESYIRLADRRTVALFWPRGKNDRSDSPALFPKEDLYLAVPQHRRGHMRYASFCVVLLLAVTSFAGAQGPKKTATGNAAFAQLTDQFVKESLALSPVNASYAGFHQYEDPKTGKLVELDAELDDVSPAAVARQEAFYRAWRARFQKETPVDSLNVQDG